MFRVVLEEHDAAPSVVEVWLAGFWVKLIPLRPLKEVPQQSPVDPHELNPFGPIPGRVFLCSKG